MLRHALNRGGWPKRTRTIFDAASHRRTEKALDALAHACTHITNTTVTVDPAGWFVEPNAAAALAVIEQARLAVHDANEQAQAKGKQVTHE